MNHNSIKVGDFVVYIPKHLLIGDRDKMIEDNNLGIVTSKNDNYIFVAYPGQGLRSMATKAEDLFTLRYRKDLVNKICEMLDLPFEEEEWI
ncbi:MAG: hypothetical protein WKF87_22585 [Chryseolinea sp.]